jgi:hypothetical protein
MIGPTGWAGVGLAAWALGASGVAALNYRRLVRCRRWGSGRLESPSEDSRSIRVVPLEEFDPAFQLGEFGPTTATEVSFIFRGEYRVLGGTTDLEAWILSVLAKSARLLFEIGTCTGKTAYLWARNAPPDAQVITMTLGPDQMDDYVRSDRDDHNAADVALAESIHGRFLYTGTDVESKIIQLYGDSKDFDETPYLGRCDLIFVDGSHAYSYIASDTEKALRMIRPGGIILWHDYWMTDSNSTGDVIRYLNELSGRLPLVWLEGTTVVAYRAPAI